MKKNIEQCANCPAEIYQASDNVYYHLKTFNRFCGVGEVHVTPPAYAGKVATPKKGEVAPFLQEAAAK